MFKMKLHLSTLLMLLFFSGLVYGQDNSVLDHIQLRSGKTVVGIITEYKAGEYIVIRKISNNRSSRYPLEAVVGITQTEGELTEGVQLPYLIKSDISSTVELKDGSRYEGEIVGYDTNSGLQLEMKNGTTLTFSDSEVERVFYDLPKNLERTLASQDEVEEVMKKGEDPPAPRPKPVYEFREEGVFNTTSFSFSFGSREQSNQIIDPFFPEPRSTTRSTIGFNIQHITGYQFSRMLGLGIGASYDAYDLEDGESIFSLFAHYRGYLTQKNIAPFIALSGGYGFALRNEDQGVTEAEGGWMLHPEIGLRLGAAPRANFTFSLGYRMQEAYYVQEFQFSGNIEYRDLVYRRMLFSLGLVF